MINHILDTLDIMGYYENVNLPTSRASETAMKQCAYEIKDNIFIWDMPGLGGEYSFPYSPLNSKFPNSMKNSGLVEIFIDLIQKYVSA